MTELDEVLEAYRDMFGTKTEHANQIHRRACEEVAALRAAASGRSGTPVVEILTKVYGYVNNIKAGLALKDAGMVWRTINALSDYLVSIDLFPALPASKRLL